MAEPVRVEMSGWKELQAELRLLPDKLRKEVVTGAAGTAAHIIKRKIIELAPVYTGKVAQGHPPPGTLKKAIYATRLTDECTATREVWLVGVRSGKRYRHTGKIASKAGPTQGVNRDAFYARWVEYGHYARVSKSVGKKSAERRNVIHTGKVLVKGAKWVMARPFFRPGFAASASGALAASEDYMRRKLTTISVAMKYLKAGR